MSGEITGKGEKYTNAVQWVTKVAGQGKRIN